MLPLLEPAGKSPQVRDCSLAVSPLVYNKRSHVPLASQGSTWARGIQHAVPRTHRVHHWHPGKRPPGKGAGPRVGAEGGGNEETDVSPIVLPGGFLRIENAGVCSKLETAPQIGTNAVVLRARGWEPEGCLEI